MQIEESFRDVKSYRYVWGLDIIVPNDLPVFIWGMGQLIIENNMI